MKNWNWKLWTAFGILVAVIIALIVLHFVQPIITYAFAEVLAGGTFVAGGIIGYLIGKTLENKL